MTRAPVPRLFSPYSRLTSIRAVTDMLDAARMPVMRRGFANIKRLAMEARARLQGKAFFCNALQGMSAYNISVNCDMTVSCNCQDDYGEGLLGDMSRDSFESVYWGPVANGFRAALARGVLPLRTCSRCVELRTMDKSEVRAMIGRRAPAPEGIMVENTSNCNLDCIACNRKSIARSRRRTRMSLDDVRRIAETLRVHGIKRVHYFKYGETFLSPTIREELTVIRETNPGIIITISTNGNFVDSQDKREAALLADHIYFSIDGVSDETLSHYQRGGSFEKAYANLREVVRLRNEKGRTLPYIEWKYVLFNWNDRPEFLAAARDLAAEAGVDVISFCPTNAPYYGKSLRFYYSPFLKKETVRRWNVREIRFSRTERP